MTKQKYAIIDIGSNTIRLVIFQKNQSGRLKDIQNVKAAARLRASLDDDGVLSLKGIERLIHTLKGFREVIEHHELIEVICVATATIRQAKNQEDILDLVYKETGFNIRVLSGYEEAFYGYSSIIHSISINEGISIDFGGGSTELTYFKNRALVENFSFPFGALSLKRQFVQGDVPTTEEMTELRRFLIEQFETLPWLKNKAVPIVMIGGSARNMVQIDQVQKNYPLTGLHQYRLTRDDVLVIKNDLIGLSAKDLLKVDGLSSDRFDTILPAIEVFDCLSEYVQAPELILSRKGLREGLLNEKLHPNTQEVRQVIANSLFELAIDYEIDLELVNQVTKTVSSLLKEFNKWELFEFKTTKKDEDLVKKASFVYNVGQYIDSESSSQHTFYLLANRTIDGLFHKEKIKMALMASYKNKQMFKQYIHPFKHWFTKTERRKIMALGALIKIGYSLHSTGRNIVDTIKLHNGEKGLRMVISCNQNWEPENYQLTKDKKHLEKLINQSIQVTFKASAKV